MNYWGFIESLLLYIINHANPYCSNANVAKTNTPTPPQIGKIETVTKAIDQLTTGSEELLNEDNGGANDSSPAPKKHTNLVEDVNENVVEVKLAGGDNAATWDVNNPLYKGIATFEDLGLSPDLLKGLYGMGFTRPSKIQEKALPLLLANPARNMVGQSQSGTGKTAAFALAMLSRVDTGMAW